MLNSLLSRIRGAVKVDQNTDVPAGAENDQRAIEDLLLFIVRALTDYPDDVKVQFVSDEDGAAFEIRANDADLGLLIGKKGQTARALESIVNSNRRRSGRHFHLDIVGKGEAEQG
jgi:uncharacterized protein